MQFFQTAVDIQDKLIEFCMNEKNIPKKYRFVYSLPIIEKAEEMVDNIVAANTIYPKTNEEVIERRRYQTQALADCEKILQKIQSLRRRLGADSGLLKEIVAMIQNERGYIISWRKSDNQRYKDIIKAKNENKIEGKMQSLKKAAAETILQRFTEDEVKTFVNKWIDKIAK